MVLWLSKDLNYQIDLEAFLGVFFRSVSSEQIPSFPPKQDHNLCLRNLGATCYLNSLLQYLSLCWISIICSNLLQLFWHINADAPVEYAKNPKGMEKQSGGIVESSGFRCQQLKSKDLKIPVFWDLSASNVGHNWLVGISLFPRRGRWNAPPIFRNDSWKNRNE